MKFLPFTFTFGRTLNQMLNEKISQEDLAMQIERMQKRGCEDSAIRKGYVSLPLRETLYKDFEREGHSHPHDKDRMIIRTYEYGMRFPNCLVTSEDEIHFKDNVTQRQAIISEDALVLRDVASNCWLGHSNGKPIQGRTSKVIYSLIRPFSEEDGWTRSSHGLDYRMAEAFTRNIFERPIDFNFARSMGYIGGSRDDKDFGREVYEIRLIVPSESKTEHSRSPWHNIKAELSKLGYKKHEGNVCLR